MGQWEEWSPWSNDDIDDAIIEELRMIAAIKKARKGQVLYWDGLDNSLYLLLKGSVEVSLVSAQGRKVILAIHHPYAFIDDALADNTDNYAVAILCLEHCEFAVFDQETMTNAAKANPKIYDCMLRSAINTIQMLTHHLANQTFNSVEDRIFNLFCNLASKYGREVEEGTLIEKRMTHQGIADMVGSTRVRVTQSLKEMRASKRLLSRGGHYIIP